MSKDALEQRPQLITGKMNGLEKDYTKDIFDFKTYFCEIGDCVFFTQSHDEFLLH